MSSEAAAAEVAARRIIVVGNANVDVLMGPIAPWPQPGSEVVADSYEWRVGGAAGNTGLALAALGCEDGVGGEVIAAVGNDFLGGWLEGAMAGAASLSRVDHSTALTVGVTHPDGQRTFLSHLGHLVTWPKERALNAIAEAGPGDLLLVCGYFLMPELRRETLNLLASARTKGMITMIDTGWPDEGWTDEVRREVTALLPHLSAFLPNREETIGVMAADESACVTTAARQLVALGAERVIVKNGGKGALLASAAGVFEQAAPTVAVKDTVGAGDTFNAGLLVGLARGLTWEQALVPAVGAASIAIASQPRRYPSWDEATQLAPSAVTAASPLSVSK